MAKDFTYRQSFETDPAAVFAMLRDPEYVQAKCAATGSLETTVDVNATPDGAVTITSTRVLPADVPAPAKKFVGETISATETQEWSAATLTVPEQPMCPSTSAAHCHFPDRCP